ncbi:MAG: hypothetical protein IT521_03530 [Burkholderiales bacterium]|nr:hypothetical protein [Burkholderiales bacterium]
MRDLLHYFRAGAALAVSILVSPGVKVKPIEGDALLTDRDVDKVWPHLRVEAVLVHAEIARRVAEANEARQNH